MKMPWGFSDIFGPGGPGESSYFKDHRADEDAFEQTHSVIYNGGVVYHLYV